MKKELMELCLLYADERIRSAEDAIQLAREAASDDTKSSAGDKYETTREMMQQEISRNEAQLLEARKLKHSLQQISTDKHSETIQNGSLVLTSDGNFYISASAGQLKLRDKFYFAISIASPIGRVLAGKRRGESFRFNGKTFEILDVS